MILPRGIPLIFLFAIGVGYIRSTPQYLRSDPYGGGFNNNGYAYGGNLNGYGGSPYGFGGLNGGYDLGYNSPLGLNSAYPVSQLGGYGPRGYGYWSDASSNRFPLGSKKVYWNMILPLTSILILRLF